MKTITSKDGTLIAYEQSGQGAPLVLVHGTSADHSRWKPVLAQFESQFTVYSMDRRGRGGSGDNLPYHIAREYEDVAALVDAIPEPVHLLGHSYGGLCSLEAALRTRNLRSLMLYEPAIFPDGFSPSMLEAITVIRDRLEAGDREGVVSTFLSRMAEVPAGELKLLKSSPSWNGRLAAAHTILREVESPQGYTIQPERFKNTCLPALILLGGDSPQYRKKVADELHIALENSRIAVMPGQQHAAMNTSPDLFTNLVFEFARETQTA
jgi:pimeloyl-ACP methyl ester carboxylesterase